MFFYIYKALRKISNSIISIYDKLATVVIFHGNRVKYGSFRTIGTPYIVVSRGAKGITIGENFAMNNGMKGSPIGCVEHCTMFVSPDAEITIGNNVGMSHTALVAVDSTITIGNNVKIGVGARLLTSDFHALDYKIRQTDDDVKHRKSAPIVIEDDAFIGTRSIILKGVTIGARSIIGAGSVVTRSIPADEVWAGNPAKFIKR
ncbi:MAG: acyltransferase, partial [Bacteroidaceae bacterium]|nr:acyltransferase [Bacteroidaceae bacterium]